MGSLLSVFFYRWIRITYCRLVERSERLRLPYFRLKRGANSLDPLNSLDFFTFFVFTGKQPEESNRRAFLTFSAKSAISFIYRRYENFRFTWK
jgi:hypothetical protein